MNGAGVIHAAAAIFSSGSKRPQFARVGALMGVNRTMVHHLSRGQKSLTRARAGMLADGLRDVAARCASLADAIDRGEVA